MASRSRPKVKKKNIRTETISKKNHKNKKKPTNAKTTEKIPQVASCPGGPTSSTTLQYWTPAVNRQPWFPPGRLVELFRIFCVICPLSQPFSQFAAPHTPRPRPPVPAPALRRGEAPPCQGPALPPLQPLRPRGAPWMMPGRRGRRREEGRRLKTPNHQAQPSPIIVLSDPVLCNPIQSHPITSKLTRSSPSQSYPIQSSPHPLLPPSLPPSLPPGSRGSGGHFPQSFLFCL